MKSLSKADLARRDTILQSLATAYGDVEDAHRAMADAIASYNEMAVAYNDVVTEAQSFAEDVAGDIDGYMTEKSDKWLEGEKGEAYSVWLEAWQGFDAPELDTDVEIPDLPDDEASAALEELAEQPE